MSREEVVLFWRRFFTDLLLGTFVNLFLFGAVGLALGMGGLYIMNSFFLEELAWERWIQWTVLFFAFGWYAGFGVLHGLGACVIHTTGTKLAEAMTGLHNLLDLLTRGVVEKIPRINRESIPREKLEETFDGIGKNFLEQLRLKKGITAFFSRILFGAILKVLKFFFLDDVVEELSKKESDITSADIEHAVRRVGVEMVTNPILENFFLLQILNCVLIILSFSIPVGILLLF
ncbi:MAG: hypothetical protein IID18_09000 [Nitrospinae bacterium]|nr:hypothetical protein [Nitrospinota bacterium]